MRISSFIPALFLLVILSCSENKKSDDGALTYSAFQNKLKMNMNYDLLVSTFGEPSKDAGSGIHIYVYPLIDSTEIWIGYTDRILYARHLDKDHQLMENVKFLNSTGTITGPDVRMCACCGGWYIQIDGINYEFDLLPVGSKIDLSTEKFPVSVKIDWQLSEVPSCGDKKIVIQKISRS